MFLFITGFFVGAVFMVMLLIAVADEDLRKEEKRKDNK